MTAETIWTKEPSTVEFNLLCFLAHPFPSSPPLQKPPFFFFKVGGGAEILNLNHPDSSFSFSFQPYLKVEKGCPYSHFCFPFLVWSRSGEFGAGEGVHPVPSSLALFLELSPWRAGDSVSLQGQMRRGAEPLLKIHLCPLRPLFFQFSTSFSSAAGHVRHSSGPLK